MFVRLQLFATAFLVVCVGSITDARNRVPLAAQPLLLGFALTLTGLAFMQNAGYAVRFAYANERPMKANQKKTHFMSILLVIFRLDLQHIFSATRRAFLRNF